MASLEFFGAPKRNMPKIKNCWRIFGAPTRAGLSAHRNTSDAETLWQRLLVSAWWTVSWIFGTNLLSFWSAGTVAFRQIKIVLFLPFSKMDNRKRLLLKLRKLKLGGRAFLLSYKMRLRFIYRKIRNKDPGYYCFKMGLQLLYFNIFYETSGRKSNQSNTANEQKEQSKTAENQWTTWGQTTTFTTICKLAQIKQGNHCEETVQPIKPCTVAAWK